MKNIFIINKNKKFLMGQKFKQISEKWKNNKYILKNINNSLYSIIQNNINIKEFKNFNTSIDLSNKASPRISERRFFKRL